MHPRLRPLLAASTRRYTTAPSTFYKMSGDGASKSSTPIEDSIRYKITTALRPSHLAIHNDSHKHAHHTAMQGSLSKETHFRLEIVSDSFRGLRLLQRHRLVNQILAQELRAEGGVHALQMVTKTREEAEE